MARTGPPIIISIKDSDDSDDSDVNHSNGASNPRHREPSSSRVVSSTPSRNGQGQPISLTSGSPAPKDSSFSHDGAFESTNGKSNSTAFPSAPQHINMPTSQTKASSKPAGHNEVRGPTALRRNGRNDRLGAKENPISLVDDDPHPSAASLKRPNHGDTSIDPPNSMRDRLSMANETTNGLKRARDNDDLSAGQTSPTKKQKPSADSTQGIRSPYDSTHPRSKDGSYEAQPNHVKQKSLSNTSNGSSSSLNDLTKRTKDNIDAPITLAHTARKGGAQHSAPQDVLRSTVTENIVLRNLTSGRTSPPKQRSKSKSLSAEQQDRLTASRESTFAGSRTRPTRRLGDELTSAKADSSDGKYPNSHQNQSTSQREEYITTADSLESRWKSFNDPRSTLKAHTGSSHRDDTTTARGLTTADGPTKLHANDEQHGGGLDGSSSNEQSQSNSNQNISGPVSRPLDQKSGTPVLKDSDATSAEFECVRNKDNDASGDSMARQKDRQAALNNIVSPSFQEAENSDPLLPRRDSIQANASEIENLAPVAPQPSRIPLHEGKTNHSAHITSDAAQKIPHEQQYSSKQREVRQQMLSNSRDPTLRTAQEHTAPTYLDHSRGVPDSALQREGEREIKRLAEMAERRRRFEDIPSRETMEMNSRGYSTTSSFGLTSSRSHRKESADVLSATQDGTPTCQERMNALEGPQSSKPADSVMHLPAIESSLGECIAEVQNDNEYWNRAWLRKARLSAKIRPIPRNESRGAVTSVFAKLKPKTPILADKKKSSETSAKLSNEVIPAYGKASKTSWVFSCDLFGTPSTHDVPNYTHYVDIKNNLLAPNDTVLQHWPYFDDEFDMMQAQGLEDLYNLDILPRPRKLVRLLQAENYALHMEDVLRRMDCSWADVLWFLLEPAPRLGTRRDAQKALDSRDNYCDEDFVRDDERWTAVLSRLPPSNPEKVARVALLCDSFQRMAKFPLWHVARRSDYTRKLLDSSLGNGREIFDKDELRCRICMRFNCPYHGEINESPTGERDSPPHEDVETDIINPNRVNFRSRVPFPESVESEPETLLPTKEVRTLQYWQNGDFLFRPDDRGPFYPCHHPGVSCETAVCSCFEDKVPCEKSCSCSPKCLRKFQGCSCSSEKLKKGQKLVCFEDERCTCFQLGRECDADLCGGCGVCDVLDPLHRHDDRILHGRCRNASIQRGVPKHTILGDSGVHGLGLYTCDDIREHEFVGEYKGEIITKDEAERRGAVYEHQKLSYLFSLNANQEIDSTYFGNKVRFINHADKSKCNLYPRIIMVNTVHRIGLYGFRYIRSGEELFFDYGPMFPDEQLGGKKSRKSAPHVRNAALVRDFYDVEESEDEYGNLRARKAATTSKGGKSASRATGASRSTSDPAKQKARPVNSKDRTARSPHGEGQGDQDVAHRLNAYYVSDEHRPDVLDPESQEHAKDDRDFEPEESASEASDVGQESPSEENDDDASPRKALRARKNVR